jgi:streptomycin 6-kinase
VHGPRPSAGPEHRHAGGESSAGDRAGKTSLRLPANLVDSVGGDPTSERRDWVAQLPRIVRELADRWSLRLGEPFQPGGRSAWVAPATDPAGRDLVLKVGWWHDEAASEADGLRAWRGRGAVLVHDACVDGPTSALLLERCRPGTSLATVLPEAEQDAIVAGLLLRLWEAPASGYRFRPLQVMCDAWASEFHQRQAAVPRPGTVDEAATIMDPGLVRAGMELFVALPGTADREVLLCADLHAGNVLAAQREPWLVIDPKPFVGDPAYDVLQHLLNCEERLSADPVALAHRMADLVGLDRGRVRSWLFARCVQESLDQPELLPVAAALAPA